MPFFFIILSVIIFSSSAFAEPLEKTFEESIPEEIMKGKDNFFTFTFENDLFGSGTDENYTNGVRLGYFKLGAEIPEFIKNIANMIPTFGINQTTSVFYSIGQNLYTPENITARVHDPDDRPYAAFLYGSAGLMSVSRDHIDEVELTLGVVGPAALGRQVQETVHDLIDADDPSGWDEQLENELGVIVSWQRRWPETHQKELGDFLLRGQPHIALSLGNVYTYAGAGYSVQFVPTKFRWQGDPSRVRPAVPGTGFFYVPEKRFAWSLFASGETRAIARNIFLDGNTFETSPSVDKEHFVTDLAGGVSFIYGRARLSYSLNWRSREFDNQDDPSLFGAISLGYRF